LVNEKGGKMHRNKCSGAIVLVFLFIFLLCPGTSRAQTLTPEQIQQMVDAYNLLMNLDNIFLTTAAEVNGVPIMYDKDKWVQVSTDILPLIPIKYGSITYPVPMWGNINCRVDVLKEGEALPEITVGAGYWNLFYGIPQLIASSMSGGMVDISFSNWNVSACISKTAGEKIRQHLGIQYSKFTGGIGGTMVDQLLADAAATGMDTSTFKPEMSSDRLDLYFGIDYTFIPRRTGFFLIGYDLLRGEIFEKIGIRFGGWVYKLGIYPGNIVAIAPSIEWTLIF